MVAPARAAAIVAGMMFSLGRGRPGASSASAASHGGLVALGAPLLQRRAALGLDRRVDDEDAAVGVGGQRRGLGRGEAVHADHGQLAGLDPPPALAVGLDQRGLHVVHGLDRAAELGHARHLLAGAVDQLGDQPLHHLRALEDVRVLEQVGLVGEDLLQAQRPLLIPGAGEAEGLVPGRQLDRAGAGAAAERDGQRLERDPVDVVLGLGLGQAERVDLHAVAEAAVLLVLRRRSARGRARPTAGPSRAAWRAPRRTARRR